MDYFDTLPPGSVFEATATGDVTDRVSTPEQSKVFAKPFRVIFKKTKTQQITGIEVTSLEGLKKIADKIAAGELTPIDSMSTLDRQLWGHLAEYVGFLRYDVKVGEFGSGIQPIGGPKSQLVDEMKEIFGGLDPGLEALNKMRDQLSKSRASLEPVTPEQNNNVYLKEDLVNLTPLGEAKLAEIAGISNTEAVSDVANALVTETEPGPTSEELEEIESMDFEPAERTGIDAELEGRRVEEIRDPFTDLDPKL